MAFFVWPWAFLFGLRPRLIFAFGGVGGLAVGLAARNVVGNLIASFLIQLNRPFVEGDEIQDAKKNLIGVVEEHNIENKGRFFFRSLSGWKCEQRGVLRRLKDHIRSHKA